MDTVAQLVDDFAVLDDWEDRYRHVIELGRGLPPLAEARHVAANKVMGCASQVWIISETSGPQQNPVLHFTGDSDALIVKGLIAVAFIIYSDKPARDILATDSAAILVRPDSRRELVTYSTADLFETDTAIITPSGREHLNQVAAWLKGLPHDKAEVVIAALCDPGNVGQTPSSAAELTKKQAEGVADYLKGQKSFKTGLVSSRKFTPLGLGQGPSPVIEKSPLPPSYLQVLVFTPQ